MAVSWQALVGRQAGSVLLGLAAAAAVAAPAPASLAPKAYRTRANALCAGAERQVTALGQPRTKAEFAGYLGKAIALERRFVADLAKLDPPASLKALHERAVALEKRQLAGVEALLRKVRAGVDPAVAVRQLSPVVDPVVKAEAANYRKLGLAACAKFSSG